MHFSGRSECGSERCSGRAGCAAAGYASSYRRRRPALPARVAAALAGDDQLEFILSEAGDGEAALALIASEEPAVILLDLNMPRLDGHAVARLVKERWPHVRVIVLTGSDSADDRRRAEQAGVDAFVEKRQLGETQLSALIASI